MSTNFAHNHITTSNNIKNKMIPNINVFCSLMKHLRFCKEDDTLIVTKYYTVTSRCQWNQNYGFGTTNLMSKLLFYHYLNFYGMLLRSY